MLYNELGKTGKKISAIGLGCEHLEGKSYEQIKETIDVALAQGINILDVFMPGKEVRTNIAKALGSRRGDVIIQGHIGSTEENGQNNISRDMPTVKRYFEEMLQIFDGYIDMGMMFFIDSEEDYKGVFETEFADYVSNLKAKGHIKHIGFSSHDPKMAMKVIQTGLPEMVLFSINPAFDMLPSGEYVFDYFDEKFGGKLFRGLDPDRAELYKLCTQKQVGITVMKALGSGKLLSAEHTPFAKALTVPQCVHYALSRPSVASVMVGCKNGAEVLDAMKYFEASDEERDYAEILGTMRNDFKGNCVYCNHCLPCPAGIDIAAVNKYLDIAKLDIENVPDSIRAHYLSQTHVGDECIACGSCETKCPFDVPVIENMVEAARIFGVK